MPLLWLSLAFLSGVLLGERLGWPINLWLLLAGLAAGWLFLRPFLARLRLQSRLPLPAGRRDAARLPTVPLPYPLIFLALCLGAARYRLAQPAVTPDFIAWYNDTQGRYTLEGLLVSPPDERDLYTNLRVQVDQLRLAGEQLFTPVSGLILAQAPPGGGWRYGDRLRLEGALQTPPESEDFSYRDYLARQGIYSLMPSASARRIMRDQGSPLLAFIYSLKARALQGVYRLFPDPEASLTAGILLGVETGIPKDVQEAFRRTGTSHIIAISGFNITIIAGLFSTFFGRLLGKRRRFLGAGLSALAISVYTLLVGADPAVVRAAIMGGLSLFARQVGRRQDGLNSLGLAAGVMALADPDVLWDVGFQLSFAATLGLVLYADPLSQAFVNFASRHFSPAAVQRLAGPVGEFFLFTLAAQVTTLPIMAYHFGSLSLSALIANPLVLPVQPAVMVVSGAAVLLGMLSQAVGQWAAYLAWPFTAYTIRVVELFARFPAGALQLGQVTLPVVVLFYTLLFGWTFIRPRLQAAAAIVKPGMALVVLAAASLVVWQVVLTAPDGGLHLVVLDVAQPGFTGDAILIQTPGGRRVLVDGGPSASLLSEALGRRLPLTERRLDWLVVAAAGDEQLQALPRSLERFPVGNVLWSGPPSGSRAARDLQASFAQAQTPVTVAQTGQSLGLGDGAVLQVLAAGPRGAVLLLKWDSFSVLLPAGLDFDSLAALQNDPDLGPLSAFLLADGGYAPINPQEWIAKLRPQVVLLSVGAGNKRGLPDPETLEAVEGYTLLRTDRNGWIELSTDGDRMWVQVERR